MNSAAVGKILYTSAHDSNGNLVLANEAEKGIDYFCPECDSPLILRKSGNVGKGAKRPHFAHKVLTPNCTPETVLHKTFKQLVAEKIGSLVKSNDPLCFSWECEYCGESHTGNFLKETKRVKLEHYMGNCTPDIALLDSKNQIFAVIEIVVTHTPEDKVVKYYWDNDIRLIQYDLEDDNELIEFETRIALPNRVTGCRNKKCGKCGEYQEMLVMYTTEGKCWNCKSKMKVAVAYGSKIGLGANVCPDQFTPSEIEIATKQGVLIEDQYPEYNAKHWANKCPECLRITGCRYVHFDFIQHTEFNGLPSEKIPIGFHCEKCNPRFSVY